MYIDEITFDSSIINSVMQAEQENVEDNATIADLDSQQLRDFDAELVELEDQLAELQAQLDALQ
jgi:ABC-type phosphate transport system auxiliary subunit